MDNRPRFVMSLVVVVSILILVIVVSSLVAYLALGHKVTMTSPQTTFDTTFTTYFYYPISINYSGPWNLVYWGENGTVAQNSSVIPGQPAGCCAWQYNVEGNLSGSGNYETTITTYGIGCVENVLCANATGLDSQGNLTLTLLAKTSKTTSNTTAYGPSVEVCATYAV